ncbi:Ribosomal protein S9 [Penicillium expansum]|uniref:Small ribosomal subunit protein uS9m n=1 Tax=Penicillium expansum TaxID=27334 RepID=A0A0A2JP62_PENEN|nr:Ribosomal protein S9 [Penicillium expansum]KGO54065.1 Ribosomal protein S9 [Penicillium expansum]KGO63426.1 Ribosomal protein S9 [Penicillium expansum]
MTRQKTRHSETISGLHLGPQIRVQAANSPPIPPAMAWHKPTSLAQAMQSLRLTSTLTKPSIQASRTTLNTLRTRTYATEAESVPAAAAPEINFGSFSQKPARIIPSSPSYFSGSPRFIDHVLQLEALQAKHAALPIVATSEAPRMAWFKLAQFRDFVGEPVPMKKYKSLVKILQRLNRIEPDMVPTEVRDTLASFLRPGNPYAVENVPQTVDENGRARGKGKRKESSAVVQLVEGEGEVLVNGKSIVEVFKRVHDRESALWALRCTQRLDKYNAWIRVQGGGVTGQAEAITLALGRALLLHEPGLKAVLRKAGAITVDARRVERKKPGHVKARKMPTWVKR